MKISIITVSHNSAETIADTLASVAEQGYSEIEHLVIDGASDDRTAEIVRQQGTRVSRFICEPDRSMYEAMNKGLALASGNVIGILNADDVYASPDVLSRVVALFSTPEIDACYGDLVYVDRQQPWREVRYWRAGPYRRMAFGHGWYPPHPTFFARRAAYESFGGFDLSFPLAADVELMLRFLGRHGLRCAYLPEVLVRMKTGGTSNRRVGTILRQNIWLYRALRKNQIAYSVWFPLLKLPSRLRQYAERANG